MKLNRLLAGIICAGMAVVQLPVGAFASTLIVDEGSELLVEEELSDTDEAAEDSVSYEEAVVSDMADPDEPDDVNYDHKLTLGAESDYDSVVIKGKDLYKGQSVGFNDGDSILITGLGKGDNIDTKNWSTYIVKWTFEGKNEYSYVYGDGYTDSEIGGLLALNNLTEDIELTVEARQLPVNAITAKGKAEGPYSITAAPASVKGDYINLTRHKDNVKVAFAIKKTGSINYEIANSAAALRFGAGNPEAITLSEEKKNYYYEIPFYDLAQLAYSETPSLEFTLNAAAKLPAPSAKVASSTDTDATLTLGVPKAAKDMKKLWYKLEAKAVVARNKTLPEGMADSAGPIYVPATVSSQAVYLMAEPGKEAGEGTAQKYDFTATLIQLESEPEYSGEPITDKAAVEGADGGNVVGVSPAKKVSGSTRKPGYEEKLGLNKKQAGFIRGEGGSDGILLATAKYSKNTTFKSLSNAKITNAAGEIVKSSDTEDDSRRIIIDGDSIILEKTDDLEPGKYTLSVLPLSRIGSPLPKAATLALTVKQGIDELTVSVPQSSYVKKANKALTIKPAVTYNGGVKAKTPAVKRVKWELLDEDENPLTDASLLFGKVTINQKNGTVTVAKDLVPSGDLSAYRFRIRAKAADYEENMAAAKTDVIELTAEETKPDTKGTELRIVISDEQSRVEESDIEFISGVDMSGGKMYVNGEEIRFRINKEGIDNTWGASLYFKPGNDKAVMAEIKDGYACFSADVVRERMKKASAFWITVFF